MTTTAEHAVESTLVRPLKSETITVRQQPRPPRPYRDTSTIRETEWTFAYANGEPLLSLTAAVITNRINGRVTGDRRGRLAEALASVVERHE